MLDFSAPQVEAVDAILRLFYVEQGEDGAATVYSRTAEQKTLLMHYVLVVALTVENFSMDSVQVQLNPPPVRPSNHLVISVRHISHISRDQSFPAP